MDQSAFAIPESLPGLLLVRKGFPVFLRANQSLTGWNMGIFQQPGRTFRLLQAVSLHSSECPLRKRLYPYAIGGSSESARQFLICACWIPRFPQKQFQKHEKARRTGRGQNVRGCFDGSNGPVLRSLSDRVPSRLLQKSPVPNLSKARKCNR